MDRRLGVLATIAALVAAACASSPGASSSSLPARATSPSADAAGSPPPGGSGPPPSGDCFTISAGSSRGPITIASIRSFATAVVAGTVVAMEPATWTTSDGSRPPTGQRALDAVLWTPLRLADPRTLLGAIGGRRIGAIGGTSGCDTYYSRDVAIPAVGQRSVFMLFAGDSAPGRRGDVLFAYEIWPVDANGLVQTQGEGTLTLDELGRRLGPAG